jgi:flagellar biogenesis protein FliO
MDTLWRLAWALPLVLAIGVATMLALKRLVVTRASIPGGVGRLSLCESLSLPNDTRVHLIEFDRQPYLLVESDRHAVLQLAPQHVAATRVPLRIGPHWMQALFRTRAR